MKHINNVIIESLLDDTDELVSKIDSHLLKDWVEKYVKCSGKVQYLKNGSVKFGGDVLIKGFDGESFPHFFKVASVNGDFKIEKCPNLKNIEGLFIDYVTIKGEYVVANCPKLESLVGGPFAVEHNMSITSNPSLKSLEGCPVSVWRKVYVMKNGKKFNKEYIKSFISIKLDFDIFCSSEEEEANIVESEVVNEALNEPHLLQLAKQLKEKPVVSGASNFNKIFGHYNTGLKHHTVDRQVRFEVPLDQLDSSNVKEYDTIDDKTDKAIRSIISKTGAMGMILCKNVDNEYIFVVNHRKQYHILNLDWGSSARWYAPQQDEWVMMEYSQIMSLIHQYASSCVVVSWGIQEWNEYLKKKSGRRTAREGMIFNTPEQNEKISRENLDRYKAMANKIQVDKKNAEFDKIDQEVEDLVNKVLKISREARRNPNKWKNYEITVLNEMIYGEYQTDYSKGRLNIIREAGVLSLYNSFISNYNDVQRGESSPSHGERWMDSSVGRLKKRIQDVKDYMSRHNM